MSLSTAASASHQVAEVFSASARFSHFGGTGRTRTSTQRMHTRRTPSSSAQPPKLLARPMNAASIIQMAFRPFRKTALRLESAIHGALASRSRNSGILH